MSPRNAVRQAIFWIVVLLIAGSTMLSYRSMRSLLDNADLVDHAQRVQYEVEQLFSLLNDAETGHRGYLLTRNERFLDPYHAALTAIPEALSQVRVLTADNPDQQRRIDRIEPLIRGRLATLAESIANRRAEAAIALPEVEIARLDRGRALMEEIRTIVNAMGAEENRLYRIRDERVGHQAAVTMSVVLVTILMGLGMMTMLFYWTNSEVRRRRAAEASLQSMNVGLEERVLARTAELAQANAALQRESAEREQVADSLRQSNESLAAIIEAAPVAIYLLDAEGKVRVWNASAERIYGYSEQESLGRIPPFIGPDHLDEFYTNFRRTTEAPAIGGLEVRRQRKDGRPVDISLSWTPMRDPDGRLRGVMHVVADVTERKSIEQQLQQAQRMEAVGQLTGGLAHDFNNLLSIVVGNLDLLMDRVHADEKALELAQAAFEGAARGAALTQRLLAFARRQPLQPTAVDVNALVENVTPLLGRTLGEACVVTHKLRPGLWRALVDPSQVEDAIVNLAINGRDAMPDGGSLIVETENVELDEDYAAHNAEVTPGPYVMLSVTDTGSGMPSDVLQHAFEPFFTTKDAGKGTGLGLSMVYGFIKQSGGHVKIYSEVGHGTTVKLYLPRAESRADADSAAPSPTQAQPSGGERILVVEDNPNVRSTAIKLLRSLGYRVDEAENGPAALALLEHESDIDLLFTDVIMPEGMTGYDLARAVKSRWPAIKVLFTSGYSELHMKNGKNGDHSTPLLTKPYRKQELAIKIRAVLDEKG